MTAAIAVHCRLTTSDEPNAPTAAPPMTPKRNHRFPSDVIKAALSPWAWPPGLKPLTARTMK
jgi:hypothetical protein